MVILKNKLPLTVLILMLTIISWSAAVTAAPGDGTIFDGVGTFSTEGMELLGEGSIGSQNSGYEGIGIGALNEAEVSILENLKSIFTEGTNNYGLDVKGASISGTTSLSISTKGDRAHGINVQTSSEGSIISFGNNIIINASGNGANGINVSGSSRDETRNAQISFLNNANITGSIGVSTYTEYGTGSVEIEFGDDAVIEGTSGSGVHAHSQGLETKITFKDRARVTGTHWAAFAEATAGLASITFGDYAMIDTSRDSAFGAVIGGTSGNNIFASMKFGDEASITTNGDRAHALVLTGKAYVEFGNKASLLAKGVDSDAIYFYYVTYHGGPLTFTNMTATSQQRNLIGNGINGLADVTFSGTSKLYGNIKGYHSGKNSNITLTLKDTTTWEGNAIADEFGTYIVNLFNNASWVIKKNSEVSNLNMNDASKIAYITDLSLENPTFNKATVGKLNGQGTLEMNVNLSLDNPVGNFLYAFEAAGQYSIIVNHNNNGGAEELPIIQVDNPDNNLTFKLSGNKINVGAYEYSLAKREIGGSALEWLLTLSNLDDKVKEESPDPIIGLDEFAKAVDATLSDEFLRVKNKLWLTSFYKLQKYDEKVLNTSLKQQMGGGIAGLDKAISDNFSVGQFFGLNIAYQNIGEGSIGHIASLTAGVYANYVNRGFLASTYLRVANYIHDLRIKGSSNGIASGTLNTYGWSASVQLSQKISFPGSALYITPKVKATYTHVEGQSFDIGGMYIRNLDITGLVTWLGVRIGVEKNNRDDKPHDYYLELGWIRDSNPRVTTFVTDEEEENIITLGKNRFEIGVGFNTSPLKKSNLNFEFKYSKGYGIEEPIKINFAGSFYY